MIQLAKPPEHVYIKPRKTLKPCVFCAQVNPQHTPRNCVKRRMDYGRRYQRCLYCKDVGPKHSGKNCPQRYERCRYCLTQHPDHSGGACPWNPVNVAKVMEHPDLRDTDPVFATRCFHRCEHGIPTGLLGEQFQCKCRKLL